MPSEPQILKPIEGPYGSLTVMSYQPLRLGWVSLHRLRELAIHAASNAFVQLPEAALANKDTVLPTILRARPDGICWTARGPAALLSTDDPPLSMDQWTNEIYDRFVSHMFERLHADGPINLNRFELPDNMGLRNALSATSDALWPDASLEVFVSPIGVARLYRQLYLEVEPPRLGPADQALTIGPYETVELTLQTSRRLTREDFRESTSEEAKENQAELKSTDDLTDVTSHMVQSNSTSSTSVGASIPIYVVDIDVQASQQNGQSTTDSHTATVRHLTEAVKRASERLTKRLVVSTRITDETTVTSTSRRMIENKTNAPVNYLLRRVIRQSRVVVQDLGPQLVWQTFVKDPGSNLGKALLSPAQTPPTAPQASPDIRSWKMDWQRITDKPEIKETAKLLVVEVNDQDWEIASATTPSRTVITTRPKAVPPGTVKTEWWISVAISDDKKRLIVEARTDNPTVIDDNGHVLQDPGWAPPPDDIVLKIVKIPSKLAVSKYETALSDYQKLIHEAVLANRYRVPKMFPARPAQDLRDEERLELLSRLKAEYFSGTAPDLSDDSPIGAEEFFQIFDWELMFYYTHPTWWRPRTLSRPDYEMIFPADSDQSAETVSAPMGASLGWEIQIDGDRARNEFLNSPWVRICVPIRKGMEKIAVSWLASHIEGKLWPGTSDNTPSELAKWVSEVGEHAQKAKDLKSYRGPDDLENWFIAKPGEPPEAGTPEELYPIIAETTVNIPADGFIYQLVDV